MMAQVMLIILLHSFLAIGLAWHFFRHYSMKRPPIGVLNLWDVTAMMGGIVLIPYLYLFVPTWLLTGLLALVTLSIVFFVFEAILSAQMNRRWLMWTLVLGVALANLATIYLSGTNSRAFFAINNATQVLVVVGIANLWAQSGMKARDATLLAAALIVYDLLFTSFLSLMGDLFTRLDGMPFAPVVAWPLPDGRWGAIGLGDLLMAAVFPLVIRKAFGRKAGWIALIGGVTTIACMLALVLSGLWLATFPLMVALGPLMVVQYAYWRNRLGQERTTAQYLRTEAF
jgi:hypothetical protein